MIPVAVLSLWLDGGFPNIVGSSEVRICLTFVISSKFEFCSYMFLLDLYCPLEHFFPLSIMFKSHFPSWRSIWHRCSLHRDVGMIPSFTRIRRTRVSPHIGCRDRSMIMQNVTENATETISSPTSGLPSDLPLDQVGEEIPEMCNRGLTVDHSCRE
ncbi:hypothetical protein EV361DRAFT_108442 [Lentinula raphanica]|nr:hypothetical protein EV361DRAFT_108442 [Lentinula raphanica]